MQAMILEQPGSVATHPLILRDVPCPEPGPGQVRLRTSVCGVCRTDLHTVEGDLYLPRRPVIPGHQVVGRIDKLGPGVGKLSVGARVGVAWLHEACGRCAFCEAGRENLCPSARFTGLHADGGYAEYLTVPAEFVYPIPDGFPDEQAAPLLCAGIIGYRALRRSGVQAGRRLGLYGFGASAHVAIQVARHWGCDVHVFTRDPGHQELARRLGAAWVGTPADAPPTPMDASVIFAPAGDLVPPALERLEKSGTLALAGIHMTDIPALTYQTHLYHEKTLTSVTAATRQDGLDLMRLAGEIPIVTKVHTFPLAEANEVLAMVKRSAFSGAAVLSTAS